MKKSKKLWMVLFLILVFLGGSPWFNSWAQPPENFFHKSICKGPLGTIYVLAHQQKEVRSHTYSGVKKSSFALDDSAQVLEPVDIVFAQEEIVVADSGANALHFYSTEGEWLRSLPLNPEIFNNITALGYVAPYFLIADNGCFWVIDPQGEIVQRVDLPRGSHGAKATISSMSIDQEKLYLANQTTQEILIYQIKSAGIVYRFIESVGGFGYEEGRFFHLTSLSAYGRLFSVDLFKPGFLDLHPLDRTLHFYEDPQGHLQAPLDILATEDQIFVACGFSDELFIFSIPQAEKIQPVLSHNILDFGTVPLTPSYIKHFYLYNASGFPMEGRIVSDHPAFVIYPQHFNGTVNQIQVTLDSKYLTLHQDLEASAQIFLPDGKTMQVMLRARVASSPDFQVVFPVRKSFSTTCDPLLFEINPQHQLNEDEFTFEVHSREVPFRFRKKSAMAFYLEPIENPSPGAYTIQFLVRSPALRAVRQFSYSFFFKHPPGTFSGSVLAEYFAADWCPLCPPGHRALLELNEEYSRDQLNFLTIYTDCVYDDPVQLCFDEGQTRMRWYVPSGTHVSLFLNGTDYIHGGTSEPGATMKPYYLLKIEPLLKQRMPISLTAYAHWDEESGKINVGATVIQPHPEKNKDLRLMVAIAENNIEWEVITGQTSHNFVSRQFIAFDNPEGDSSFGSPLSNMEKQNLMLEAMVDPVVNIDQSFILVFVQDRKTRQIYQTRYVPIKPDLVQHHFALTSNVEKLVMTADHPQVARFYLQNRGNYPDQYTFQVNNAEAYPQESKIRIRQETFKLDEPLTVKLNPMEILAIDILTADEWDLDAVPAIQCWALSHASREKKEALVKLSTINEAERPYQWLFPSEEQLVHKDGFFTYLPYIEWTIKAPAGSRLQPDEGVIYQDEGLIRVPWKLSPGWQEGQWTLILPDQSREVIQFGAFRKLSIILTIDSNLALINGEESFIDASPMIINQRTLVPLRFIAEAFDAEISYESATRTVTLTYEDTRIQLQIDEVLAFINGEQVELDVPPVIDRGRTFVPVRFIAETFGAEVSWDASTRQVFILIS